MWYHKFDPHTHVPELPQAALKPMPDNQSMARPLGGPVTGWRRNNDTVKDFLDRSNINNPIV